MKKINVGCGWECRDGWINVDNTQKPQRTNYPITYMDSTDIWPYPDNHFDAVLSEHMIEHLPEEKGLFFLQEAFRTLKVGGVIRISCPEKQFHLDLKDDGHPFLDEYAKLIYKRPAQKGDAQRIRHRALNMQGHVWVPTVDELLSQISRAGFCNVTHKEFGVSDYEVFDGIELQDGFGAHIRKYESVCVEAMKC